MLLLSCLSIYKLPLIKKNFNDHIYPLLETISFSADQISQKTWIQQIEAEKNSYLNLKTMIMNHDSEMTATIVRIFTSLFLDVLASLCLAVLFITVYRFLLLKKITKERKISWNFQEHKNNSLPKIHILIFEQFVELILDIPAFFVVVLIAVLFPWRFYKHFIKRSDQAPVDSEKEKKQNIEIDEKKMQKKKNKIISRTRVYLIFLKGITDVIGIIVLLFVLLAFWRWNYFIPAMKKISKREKVNLIDQDNTFSDPEKVRNNQKLLVATMFKEVLKDLIYLLPFALIMVLFIYPTVIYYYYLKHSLNAKAHQFFVHRKTAQYCCLFVLIHILILFLGLIILVTAVRIDFTLKLFKITGINHLKEKHKKRDYYEAHLDCIKVEMIALLFVLIDFFALFGFVIILISVYRIKEWKEKRNELKILSEKSEADDKFVVFEEKKNNIIFDLAKNIFLDFLALLIFILLSILILWRIPTFYCIFKNLNFEKEVVDRMAINKIVFEEQSKISKLQAEICFCFVTMIQDLPYLPIFLIDFLLVPWRFSTFCLGIYHYDDKKPLQEQIEQFRANLISEILFKGIMDYVCLIEFLLIVVTLIKLPFFYFLLQKNFKKHKGLSIYQCVHITFTEMLKDLPFFFLGILILFLAPWRLYTIMKIIRSIKERLPSFDHEDKTKIKVVSRRSYIWYLFLRIFTYDYVNIFMIIFLLLSIYKAVAAFEIVKILWETTYYENQKYQDYDVRKNLINHVITVLEDSKSVFYVLAILILVIRVEPCYKRFKILFLII